MFSRALAGSTDTLRSKRFYDAVPAAIGTSTPFRRNAVSDRFRLCDRHANNHFCFSARINDGKSRSALCGRNHINNCYCDASKQIQPGQGIALAQRGQSCEDLPTLRGGAMKAMDFSCVVDTDAAPNAAPDTNTFCAIYHVS